MAEIKAHEFDGAINRIMRDNAIFLVYGPDRGLVSERATALAGKSGVALDDAFSVIRLDAADLASDPGRLIDETASMGLFGGKRLVWVRSSGTEKSLQDGMAILLQQGVSDCVVIVEAGDLKKGTGLRKAVETASGAVAIPCYADDDRAIGQLIEQELGKENLSISPEARQRLIDHLGGDRIASRNELRKLALYARGEPRIEDHHVIEIVGDASAISVDDAVDAILSGNEKDFVHAIQKVIASKTPVFLVLQACLRQLQMIDLMRAEMDEQEIAASKVMATLGRSIHFRRKPIVERALDHWSAKALAAELSRLQSAVLLSRQNAPVEDSIAMQTLLATTLQSRRK